jgi:hypothetical protein
MPAGANIGKKQNSHILPEGCVNRRRKPLTYYQYAARAFSSSGLALQKNFHFSKSESSNLSKFEQK